MAFLHGVETIEKNATTFSVPVVETAIICLTGIAPYGSKNVLKQIKGTNDATYYGAQVPGFSIPQALDAIFKQGPATVVVNNIFDKTTMVTAVTSESVTVANRAAKTAYAPVIDSAAPTVKDSTDATTYVLNTDYTIDDYGNLVIISAAIAEGAVLHVTYKKLNASAVTATLIVGANTSGVRTGMILFEETLTTFGYKPKLLIAPGYSTLSAVAAQLAVDAVKFRAHYMIDAPLGTSISTAIAGRGPSGSINFYTADKRAILLFPELKAFSPAINDNENRPYSQFMAGVISNNDSANGYHVSPSNKKIAGVVDTEIKIVSDITNTAADCQVLNAAAITTTFSAYGTGIRTFGNRNASYNSSNTGITTFISVVRTADIIEDSIEQASLDFIDIPLNQAGIDIIRNAINNFFKTLIGKGIIIGGECTFDKSKNSDGDLAAGHLVLDYNFLPPPPVERLTYNSTINISLLSTLK